MTVPMLTLCMIVKNEEQNIVSALESARPFIDAVAIVDTGSTDATPGIIRAWCSDHKVKGQINTIQPDHIDFGAWRTQALALAREVSEGRGYSLMMDADDIVSNIDVKMMHINVAYQVMMELSGVQFALTSLFDNGCDWRYRGVVHEFPDDREVMGAVGPVVGHIVSGKHGSRSRDPLKYLHDAETINRALMAEQDQFMRNRYCFYLAQSYRDAKHSGAAIYWYEIVAKGSGWSEERYVAALNLGRLTHDRDWFVQAAQINPHRAEAWRALGLDVTADHCRIEHGWLFVERSAYKTRSLGDVGHG